MTYIFLFILGSFSIGTLVILWKLGVSTASVLKQIGHHNQVHPWILVIVDLASALVIGVGAVIAFSPLALYQWLHGSSDRYIWIISGPYPYSHFGGGPFQFYMYSGLFATGMLAIGAGLLIRLWFWIRIRERMDGKD